MKKILLLLTVIFSICNISLAQDRGIARGAEPGELYLTGLWYGIYYGGPPSYSTLRSAVYRLTENGKKLTIQYDTDYFANPENIMRPDYILADATPGVVYNKCIYEKNEYDYTQLWVSFDYGKNWIFREEVGYAAYYSGIFTENNQSIIYKGSGGMSFSTDYGQTWTKIENTGHTQNGDIGFSECEFYGLSMNSFYYTQTCFNTYTTLEIDKQYIFGQIWGIFPDAYCGGLPGEVYVSSMFPGVSYKVSFSADTGHTFRHVYVSEILEPGGGKSFPVFMSDREPGVFYIIRSYQEEDFNPRGWHKKFCVEYYRDYGETLVATYCHDLTKDYKNGVEVKEVKKSGEVILYPNPAFTTVTVDIADQARNDVSKVEIYNTVGQLLQVATTKTVDVSSYNAGIYFFKVFDMDNNSVTKRVVVVR